MTKKKKHPKPRCPKLVDPRPLLSENNQLQIHNIQLMRTLWYLIHTHCDGSVDIPSDAMAKVDPASILIVDHDEEKKVDTIRAKIPEPPETPVVKPCMDV